MILSFAMTLFSPYPLENKRKIKAQPILFGRTTGIWEFERGGGGEGGINPSRNAGRAQLHRRRLKLSLAPQDVSPSSICAAKKIGCFFYSGPLLRHIKELQSNLLSFYIYYDERSGPGWIFFDVDAFIGRAVPRGEEGGRRKVMMMMQGEDARQTSRVGGDEEERRGGRERDEEGKGERGY